MRARSDGAPRSAFSVVSRLRISLSLVIAAVAITSMALASFSVGSKTKAEFAEKAETSARYLGSTLGTPMWNYDDDTVGIVGAAFFRDEDVASLRIEDQFGKVIFADRRSASADISRTVAVMHGNRQIGRAELSLTYRGSKSRFLAFMFQMAASMAAILAATLVLARYLVKVYLKRPLDTLSERVACFSEERYSPDAGAIPIVEFAGFVQVLESMASRILEQLADLRRLNRELEEIAVEKDELIAALKTNEARLAGSLKEKSVLLRELYHRTKNNMQVICSMLSLRSAQLGDEAAKAIIADASSHIHSMALVHEMLYESHNLSSIDLDKYLAALARFLAASEAGAGAHASLSSRLDPVAVTIDEAIPIGLIVTELVTNAMRHAGAGRDRLAIRISLASREGLATLEVADDGPGFPPGFDWRSSESMGLRIVKTLAEQLQSSIEFDSSGGLRCSLSFRVDEKRPRPSD